MSSDSGLAQPTSKVNGQSLPFPSIATDSTEAPGHLLDELERRQDDVLAQLDDLDAKINEVLKGLGASVDDDENGAA